MTFCGEKPERIILVRGAMLNQTLLNKDVVYIESFAKPRL
jgi:hypothetical protein